MLHMLNIAVIEEHNSRDMKNRAEKNKMTNAFNILKKIHSIGKQAQGDKGSVLSNDRDMRNRWNRYVLKSRENNSDARQEVINDPPASRNIIKIF